MFFLDLDTIELFGCTAASEEGLQFGGEIEGTYCTIRKKDNASVASEGYFKVVNPTSSLVVTKILLFRNLKDAMAYYKTKSRRFFAETLMVATAGSVGLVAGFLKKSFVLNRKERLKTVFFHIENDFTLVSLQISLLNLSMRRNIACEIGEGRIRIMDRNGPRELDFRRSLAVLGAMSRDCFFVNRVLDKKFLNIFLTIG